MVLLFTQEKAPVCKFSQVCIYLQHLYLQREQMYKSTETLNTKDRKFPHFQICMATQKQHSQDDCCTVETEIAGVNAIAAMVVPPDTTPRVDETSVRRKHGTKQR